MKLKIFSTYVLLMLLLMASSCVTSHDYNMELSCEDFAENSKRIPVKVLDDFTQKHGVEDIIFERKGIGFYIAYFPFQIPFFCSFAKTVRHFDITDSAHVVSE